MGNELKVAIVGPAGKAGLELVQMLFRHPRLRAPLLLSLNGEAGSSIAPLVPELQLNGKGAVHPFSWSLVHRSGVDLLFVAESDESSDALPPQAVEHGLLVIDAAASGCRSRRQRRDAVAGAVRKMNLHYGWGDSEGLA